MNCPHCGHDMSRVTITRRSDTGVRRTRRCDAGHRFATQEVYAEVLGRFVAHSAAMANVMTAAMAVEQAGERGRKHG